MPDQVSVECRRQFCSRCGQFMFEYFRSPDGHFGLADAPETSFSAPGPERHELSCPACGARYRLLERLNAMGAPVERK